MSEAPTEKEQRLQAVLAKIRSQGNVSFPAVAKFMTEIHSAIRSPNTSAQQIANLILKDVALTSTVLRLVNSAFYSTVAGQRISTISRAVVMLGTETISNLLLGLNVFEHFNGRSEIGRLKSLTVQSLLNSVHARELSRTVSQVDPEEAFIAGMLHNLGHMAVAFYLPAESAEIEALVQEQKLAPNEACLRVLKLSYAEIGEALAREWNLPPSVAESMFGVREDRPRGTQTLQAVVALSADLSRIATIEEPILRKQLMDQARDRYKKYVPLTDASLSAAMAAAGKRMTDLTYALRITRKDLEVHAPAFFPPPRKPVAPPAQEKPAAAPQAAPAPIPAQTSMQDHLLRSLDDIAQVMATEYSLNDVLMMVLETIYRGIGFDHAMLTLVTPSRDALKGRLCLGDRATEIMAAFRIPLDGTGGPLAEVISKQRELSLSDTSQLAPSLAAVLQAAYILMLPIVVEQKAIGALYVQRARGQGPPTERQVTLLRTLRNHAVMAIRQARKG